MADTATLTLRADISELQRKLRSIPDEAGGSAKQMAVTLEREFKRATAAAEAAARASAAAHTRASSQAAAAAKASSAASIQATEAAAKQQREGLKGLGELVGLPMDRIEKLGQAVGLVSGPLAAMAGGAAAAAAAVGLAAAATVSLVRSAIDLEKEIGPLREQGLLPPLPPGYAEQLEEADNAMRGATTAAQALVVQVGGALAPAVEWAAVAAGELVNSVMDSGDTLRGFGQIIKSGVIVWLQTLADWALRIPALYANMAGIVGDALSSIGFGDIGSKLSKVSDDFLDFKNSIGSSLVNGAIDDWNTGVLLMGRTADVTGGSIKKLGEAQRSLGDKTSGASKASKEAAQASKDAERAARDLAKAYEDVAAITAEASDSGGSAEWDLWMAASERLAVLDEIAKRYENQPDLLAKTAAAEAAVNTQLIDQIREQRAVEAEELEKAKQTLHERDLARAKELADHEAMLQRQRIAGAQAVATFAGGVSDLMMQRASANAEHDRRLALKQFKAGKAAAIAQATINGALAITTALAQLGPIFGTLAAGGIIAATAAQIGIISSQKPAFDRGGMIQGGMMADQVPINALPGEAVLSRGAVRAVGGQAGVDRLNRGESGAPQVVVVETYKHFGRFVQDELGRAGVLQRAMLAGRPVGALGY